MTKLWKQNTREEKRRQKHSQIPTSINQPESFENSEFSNFLKKQKLTLNFDKPKPRIKINLSKKKERSCLFECENDKWKAGLVMVTTAKENGNKKKGELQGYEFETAK